MQFVLLIYRDEAEHAAWSEARKTENHLAYKAFTGWAQAEGILVSGEPLDPGETANTVRMREGRRAVVAGPAVESAEVLEGYYLLECADVAQAVDAAARCPGAEYGSVEVRPVRNYGQNLAGSAD